MNSYEKRAFLRDVNRVKVAAYLLKYAKCCKRKKCARCGGDFDKMGVCCKCGASCKNSSMLRKDAGFWSNLGAGLFGNTDESNKNSWGGWIGSGINSLYKNFSLPGIAAQIYKGATGKPNNPQQQQQQQAAAPQAQQAAAPQAQQAAAPQQGNNQNNNGSMTNSAITSGNNAFNNAMNAYQKANGQGAIGNQTSNNNTGKSGWFSYPGNNTNNNNTGNSGWLSRLMNNTNNNTGNNSNNNNPNASGGGASDWLRSWNSFGNR